MQKDFRTFWEGTYSIKWKPKLTTSLKAIMTTLLTQVAHGRHCKIDFNVRCEVAFMTEFIGEGAARLDVRHDHVETLFHEHFRCGETDPLKRTGNECDFVHTGPFRRVD